MQLVSERNDIVETMERLTDGSKLSAFDTDSPLCNAVGKCYANTNGGCVPL